MAFNNKMHERNIYRNRPDFAQIALDFPLFRKYAVPNAKGKIYVDFSNTDALRMLTKILLKKDFDLDVEIPYGFLIPTIPQRLNYILWVEDLLANIVIKNEIPTGIDIGTGPCSIFSLLGAKKNGWSFVATESSDDAICWAKKNIERNDLMSKINVVKVSQSSTLKEILSGNETYYEFCLCNPPFYENPEELRKKFRKSDETIADVTQVDEIFFKGGEVEFVKNILKDSLVFKKRVCLFTSMFGKKNSYLQILKEIKEFKDAKVATTEFCQGNTVRWGIAWTFDESVHFEEVKKKEKPKKSKPPLEYEIPIVPKSLEKTILKQLLQKTHCVLNELEILTTTIKSTGNFAELLLKSNRNTWTHQRRKRRELERKQKDIKVSEKVADGIDAVSVCGIVSKTDNSLLKSEKKQSSSELISCCEKDMKDNEKLMSENQDSKIETDLQQSRFGNHDISKNLVESKYYEEILTVSEYKHNSLKENHVKMPSIKRESSDSPEKSVCNEIEIPEIKSEKISNVMMQDDCSSGCDISLVKKRKDVTHDDLPKPKKVKLEEIDPSVCYNEKLKDFGQGDLNQCKNMELEREDPVNSSEGTVLHCHLQLIKGRSKVYVKMNCPPSADRNSMYQVFQIIKNKLK